VSSAIAFGQFGGKESADEAVAWGDCRDVVAFGLSLAGTAQRSVFVSLDGAAARHDRAPGGWNSLLLRAGGGSGSGRAGWHSARRADHSGSSAAGPGTGTHRSSEQVFAAGRVQLSKLVGAAGGSASDNGGSHFGFRRSAN
jgi:hypothetical protein